MPLLFSLGINDSRCAADERLRPEDKLFAFLDDVHVVYPTHRTRGAYNILEQEQGSSPTRAKLGERLDGEHDVGGCLMELRSRGFVGRPSWVDLQSGGRPPPSTLT